MSAVPQFKKEVTVQARWGKQQKRNQLCWTTWSPMLAYSMLPYYRNLFSQSYKRRISLWPYVLWTQRYPRQSQISRSKRCRQTHRISVQRTEIQSYMVYLLPLHVLIVTISWIVVGGLCLVPASFLSPSSAPCVRASLSLSAIVVLGQRWRCACASWSRIALDRIARRS